MTDHELLVFIAEKVVSLESRMDSLGHRLDSIEARIDSLEERVASLESQMDSLGKEVRRNSMLIENEILPRLQTIERLYVDSSNTFMNKSTQIEQLQDDVDVLKIVVEDHSSRLEKIS